MDKETIAQALAAALNKLRDDGALPEDCALSAQEIARKHVERSRDAAHGDFASNLALQLAKQAGKSPREVAKLLLESMPAHAAVERVEMAGPGFLNFFGGRDAGAGLIEEILRQKEAYGRNDAHRGEKVQVEFISANPTGPLHVGHGRGGAYGDSAARLLEANGYTVEREYYVNDAGRQMDILGLSVWLRYLQIDDAAIPFPDNGYQGEYIEALARRWRDEHGRRWQCDDASALSVDDGGDPEQHLDQLIAAAHRALGEAEFGALREAASAHILDNIREDLRAFRIDFDRWFSERSLSADVVDDALRRLQDGGHTEERDGALWFLSTKFGDDRDRVLRRSNGQTTYFASDVAYHADKFKRGYKRIINVWGADHHGYVKRLQAAMSALNLEAERLEIRLVQLMHLKRGDEQINMSTRQGEFVPLRQLHEEVGVDAARFFYVMRRVDADADFDLKLAVTQNKDNPVYYVQYAHARVCNLFERMKARDLDWGAKQRKLGLASTSLLSSDEEQTLIKRLSRWPDVVADAGRRLEPHLIAGELRELAAQFHICYNKHRYLDAEEPLRCARLCLASALRQVLANGLAMLGVSAPDNM